ncbi:MAG: response regulator [Candidatus Dadabacteria bacterium]|nr:MAG: response regulator [Candidatus Dadabacteria bacterium]
MEQEKKDQFSVLIVDDDPSFRKILTLKLRSFLPKIKPVEFSDLESTRAFFNNNPNTAFDLVVLDENLPDGSGQDLLKEGLFKNQLVIAISSEEDPEIPGSLLKAGAAYFINKDQINKPLFKPLIMGIIERNKLARKLLELEIQTAKMDTIKTLVATLRHEINNPLGVVLSGAYLVGSEKTQNINKKEAAELIEKGGKRIKEVLDKLCQALELEEVVKGGEKVIHIPGDKPWENQHKPEKN